MPATADTVENTTEIKIETNWGGKRDGAGRKPRSPVQRFGAPPIGRRWYVLELIGRSPTATVRDLLEGEARAGYIPRPPYTVELPMTPVERLRSGIKVTVHLPMFPGYAFACFDLYDDWQPMLSCDGVKRIISAAFGRPIPLPIGFVEGLIRTAGDRLHLPKHRLQPFPPGQAVRIDAGPFDGYRATVCACDGLSTVVQVHVFGRFVEIVMLRAHVSVRSS